MKHFIKFALVGGSGSFIGLGILWLFTEIAGWYYLASLTLALLVSVSNNYFWNSKWTFKDKKANIKGFGKYLSLSAGTLVLNLTLVYILTDIIGLWYMLSAIITTGIVFLINFTLSRKYVWNSISIK